MKFLILNQTFHPDVVPTAQFAADLGASLAADGHHVTALASNRAYDQPGLRFASREQWRRVEIQRVGCLSFASRRAAWKRALTFATFILNCGARMWRTPKPDVVIAMTSPPLISVLGALLARVRGAQFVLWIMDMNPDEAVAAGWLRSGSLTERLLRWLLHFSLRSSARVIVLDRFMRDLVVAKGVPGEQIAVVPPWPFSQDVAYTTEGRESFRRQHGLSGKFVVMFAGNHSPCHPLDTLLAAAQNLAGRKDIVFCFVGGGADYERVCRFASERKLDNIICLGYRTRYELSGPLSAADLQVIAMGDPFVGIVHPCKVYNIATLGIPALYIGPEMSPIPEVLSQVGNGYQFFHARHGEVQRVESLILRAAAGCKRLPPDPEFMRRFAQESLIGRFRSVLSELEEPGPDIMCNPVRAHQS